MKYTLHILLVTFIMCSSTTSFSQSQLSALENNKSIQSISIDKKMFNIINSVKIDLSNPEDKAYYDLIKKLETLKVLTATDPKNNQELITATKDLIQEFKLTPSTSLENLKENSTLYIGPHDTNHSITQLMIVNQSELDYKTIVLYLTGQFELQELPVLLRKMNLPLTK